MRRIIRRWSDGTDGREMGVYFDGYELDLSDLVAKPHVVLTTAEEVALADMVEQTRAVAQRRTTT